jgi:hypothetical protein
MKTSGLEVFMQRLNAFMSIVGNLDYINIGKNALIVFSIAMVHFATYILSFDLNSIILLDFSSVVRYYFKLTIIVAIVVAIVRIFQTSLYYSIHFNHYMTAILNRGIAVEDPYLTYLDQRPHQTLERILHPAVLYSISSMIISIIFIGLANTLYLIGMLAAFVVITFIGLNLGIMIRQIVVTFWSYTLGYERREDMEISISRTPQFWLEQWRSYALRSGAVVVILVAVLLGFFRADFVRDTHRFQLDIDGQRRPYSIFLTSSAGIFLWNPDIETIQFIPWDAGVLISVDPESRRSFVDP